MRVARSYLMLTRTPYEEPDVLNLHVRASNGRQTGQLEIYANADDLIACADALEPFPRDSADAFLWELGSERPEEQWAFHFRLRVFLTRTTGECAVQVRLSNNRELPDREISEFCLQAIEPSQVNRLGRLFREYAALRHEVLFWNVREGMLLSQSERRRPGR